VNALIESKGGISVAGGDGSVSVMPLPIAGLMSLKNGHQTAEDYTRIDAQARALGTRLHAPFMTLSFMALLVIPALKLSDKGLFDGGQFQFVTIEKQ
jgi:adenine deaminase